MAAESASPTAVIPVSGTGLDGVRVTDVEVLDHVRSAGSIVIIRGPAERLGRRSWADELTVLARSQGVRLSVQDTGRAVLILDIDWDGRDPQLHATCDESSVKANHPSRWVGPRLVHDAKSSTGSSQKT
jgi:hypothetical protein